MLVDIVKPTSHQFCFSFGFLVSVSGLGVKNQLSLYLGCCMIDGKFPKGNLCLFSERKPASIDDRAVLPA